jgi:hypothetical protein
MGVGSKSKRFLIEICQEKTVLSFDEHPPAHRLSVPTLMHAAVPLWASGCGKPEVVDAWLLWR